MLRINMPEGANKILRALVSCDKEAYIVGGCVRDTCLGKEPHDWDICTQANPEEVIKIFKGLGHKVFPTGLQHGTVMVVIGGAGFEVTTFRKDGEYSDGRHPDKVEFTSDLCTDLSRRDFTMNAMAFSPTTGLIDPFGGQEDMRKGVIRCVGDPGKRFREDALRILRAVRFASVTGYEIEVSTLAAMRSEAKGLKKVSQERKQKELVPLLQGGSTRKVLVEYGDILAEVIPEILPCIGFVQNNPYHPYDVWEHTAYAVALSPQSDWLVRLALLLHDIGKPECYQEDEAGVGHFHGHGKVSQGIAESILMRLRFDNETVAKVTELVGIHDRSIEATPKAVRRLISQIGSEQFFRLMDIRTADICAQASDLIVGRMEKVKKLREIGWAIVDDKPCLSIKDLAINGHDLIAAGIKPGPEIGRKLKSLLDNVIEDPSLNEKEILLKLSRNM